MDLEKKIHNPKSTIRNGTLGCLGKTGKGRVHGLHRLHGFRGRKCTTACPPKTYEFYLWHELARTGTNRHEPARTGTNRHELARTGTSRHVSARTGMPGSGKSSISPPRRGRSTYAFRKNMPEHGLRTRPVGDCRACPAGGWWAMNRPAGGAENLIYGKQTLDYRLSAGHWPWIFDLGCGWNWCVNQKSKIKNQKSHTGRSSAWLERCVRDAEVAGSNPVAPTLIKGWSVRANLFSMAETCVARCGCEADTRMDSTKQSVVQSSRPDWLGWLSGVDNRPFLLSRADVTPTFRRNLRPAPVAPIPPDSANR